MQLIAVNSVLIPEDRVRKEFPEAHLRELADSIESKGLAHAIVLRPDGETLLAGENRLMAMERLHKDGRSFEHNGDVVPVGMIPYTLSSNLAPDDLLELELEENLRRKDLTWQEEAKGLAKLQNLRERQAEAKGEKATVADTVRELAGGDSPHLASKIARSKILVDHLDDPEVSSAKTPRDAEKIIRKRAEAKQREELARDFKPDESRHDVYNVSCLEMLPMLRAETYDVILTDPPYGMGADTFGDMAGEKHGYNDSHEWFMENISTVLEQCYRVAAEKAHLYLFCDIDQFAILRQWAFDAGWKVHRTPMIWSKRGGMLPWPESGPRRTYELILYATKGNKRVHSIEPDIIEVPLLSRPRYGAEKPAELYRKLLARSVLPGDRVLDPFAGCGPIIPAANSLQCRATTIELDKEKNDLILTRLEERASGDVLEDL